MPCLLYTSANVAVSLANYGLDAAFVTKLPAHAIGQAAVNSLRRYGVDTSMIDVYKRQLWRSADPTDYCADLSVALHYYNAQDKDRKSVV